jgi:hypothetical protein
MKKKEGNDNPKQIRPEERGGAYSNTKGQHWLAGHRRGKENPLPSKAERSRSSREKSQQQRDVQKTENAADRRLVTGGMVAEGEKSEN